MSTRFRTLVLVISLAVNVFIVGAAVGGVYMWHASGLHRPHPLGLRYAARKLSVPERKAFRRMLAETRRQAASDAAQAKSGRMHVAQLMMADPIDRQAIDAQLSTIRQADIAVRTRIEKTVIDFFQTLPPAERQSFVAGLRGHGAMLRGLKASKN